MATKNPHKKLGARIKYVLSLTKELQKTIAKKAGCQPTEFSRWKRGEVAPSYNKLVAIGRALNLNGDELSWLFDGKGQAPDYPGYKELDENCKNEVKEAEGTSDKADQKHLTEKDKPSMDLLETKDKLISNLENTATSEPDTKNEFIKTLKEFNVHLREENAELKKEIIALRGG